MTETLELAGPALTESEIGLAVSQADRCLELYIGRCRKRIPAFVERNFSLAQTWTLQRRTLWLDLLFAPINSVWALPHLAVQKTALAVERVGFLGPAQWAKRLPPGLKTGYQREIEKLIRVDLLEWNRDRPALPQGLVQELEAHPPLRALIGTLERKESVRNLDDLVRNFSSGRAIVSDLFGTLLTLALSWWTLGSASLSLKGIAYGMAKKDAHDRAASKFFLGKKLGNHFYNVFQPAVSESRVTLLLVLLAVGLSVGAMACTILSDPIRKVLGFHRNRLEALVDEMERELIVATHTAIAAAYPKPL